MSFNKEEYLKEQLGDKYVPPVIKEEPKPVTPEPPKNGIPLTPEPKELSDEELLALLNKRNINVSSLDDLLPKPTAEELENQKKERNSKMLAWGLENKKFKQEDYESLIKLQSKADKIEIEAFENDLRENHKDWTEEQFQDAMKDYTLSFLPEDHPARIRREKELKKLGETQLSEKYSSILNLEKDYEHYESSENQRSKLKRQVEAGIPVYKSDVENVIESFKKMDFTIEDKEHPENNVDIPFEFSADLQNELRNAFFNGDYAVNQIKNGYTKESLTAAAKVFLIDKALPSIVANTARKFNSIQKEKYINGRRGIIPPDLSIDAAGSGNPSKDEYVARMKAEIAAEENKK